MYSKKEKRFYKRFYSDRAPELITVTYTLWFDANNFLVDVRNEFHFSVERNSEVWDFFYTKYNQL